MLHLWVTHQGCNHALKHNAVLKGCIRQGQGQGRCSRLPPVIHVYFIIHPNNVKCVTILVFFFYISFSFTFLSWIIPYLILFYADLGIWLGIFRRPIDSAKVCRKLSLMRWPEHIFLSFFSLLQHCFTLQNFALMFTAEVKVSINLLTVTMYVLWLCMVWYFCSMTWKGFFLNKPDAILFMKH